MKRWLQRGHLVARALRQFFLAHLLGAYGPVGMPSRVVDDLWHAFILDTRAYSSFCEAAFGSFLHHMPATSMGASALEDAGLRRIWRQVCIEENIDWRKPTRMPLLFAIDEKLGIVGGFHYSLEREAAKAQDGAPAGGGCSGGSGPMLSGVACSGDGLIGDSGSGGSGGDGGDGGAGCGGGCGGGGGGD